MNPSARHLSLLVASLLLAVTILLPQRAMLASHDVGPDAVYFPETGHTLQHGFLDFWRHNGGLPIFGYPISEEFSNPQTDVTTQYFERAVFEWHPENDPHWWVLLHRLGAEMIEGRENEPPFQPASPSGAENCAFVSDVGHNICSGFRDYWNENGGLPVFGYPLSEELAEDGRTVQYFERARFEWHPENAGTVYGVLLGRLGAEKAARLGIDTSSVAQPGGVPTYSSELWQAPEPDVPDTTPPEGFMLDMQSELSAMMARWSGENSVSVTDLQSGQTISVNGDQLRPASCTIKIPLMIAITRDISAGLYTHNDIAGLVYEAMSPSLTPPARELISIAGGGSVGTGVDRINRIMDEFGATSSILAHPPGYPFEDYGYSVPYRWHTNVLTTDDANAMLTAIYHGQGLTASERDYVLRSLSLGSPHHFESLGGPLPGSVTLYNKIGIIHSPFASWSDGALVIFESGGQQRAYAISYLGAHGDGYEVHYNRGYAVSEVAWRYFSQAY
jgi:hypothetical protein